MITRPGALERPYFWKEVVDLSNMECGSKHDLIAPTRAKL